MSKTNASPSVPGAAQLIGLVPNVVSLLLETKTPGVALVKENPFAKTVISEIFLNVVTN